MPTKKERDYYSQGFRDGYRTAFYGEPHGSVKVESLPEYPQVTRKQYPSQKGKRKLSAWNKFVKANSNKKIYKFANGKLKLKKMGIAFRKTRAGRKK